MKLDKKCKTCEFNFDGICAGHGDIYKYGESISDENKSCGYWNANFEFFNYITINAPRFLREAYKDCRISYNDFLSSLENYDEGNSVPINFFDAVKFIYGISMVDIAVLLDVSFGVVYRTKTNGIPQKRINQFAEVLFVSTELLTSVTTQDFDQLRAGKETFFSQPHIEQRLNALPEWKWTLVNTISSVLHCPIHMAKEFARVDKMYWTAKMLMDDFTESEKALVKYVSHHNQYHKPGVALEYSLDLACAPHISIRLKTE